MGEEYNKLYRSKHTGAIYLTRRDGSCLAHHKDNKSEWLRTTVTLSTIIKNPDVFRLIANRVLIK